MSSSPPTVTEPNSAPDTRRGEPWRSFLFGVFAVSLISGILWVNVLDVRITWVRLFYGAICLWLIVWFFVRRFRSWKSARVENGRRSSKWLIGWWTLELILSILVLLLALESGARALEPMSNSSTNYPGAKFVWPERSLRRNRFGLNDYGLADKMRGPRVLILGDSYVEGAGVRREERFCSQLRALLRKAYPAAEVIAAGLAGWDTADEESFLKQFGPELAPDVVVVAYVLNDAQGEDHLTVQPTRWELWLQTQLRSYLCYRVFRWRRPPMSQYWEGVKRQHDIDSPGWRNAAQSLQDIEAWCRDKKIPCQLVVLPIFSPDADSGREVMEQVARRAKEMGFHSYQTLDDFDGHWGAFAVSPYDAHPNAAGHQRIAKRIEAELKATNALHE